MAKVKYLSDGYYRKVMSHFDSLYKACQGYIDKWEEISGLSDSVRQYSLDSYCINDIKSQKVAEIKQKLHLINDFRDYIAKKQQEVYALDSELSGGGGGYYGGGGGGAGSGYADETSGTATSIDPTTTPLQEAEDIHVIPATAFDKLTESQNTALKEKLKALGFTDKEIEDIFNGKMSVNKITLDKLSAVLSGLKDNQQFIKNLEEIFGISLYNADGTVNSEYLALFMLMAGKGLGMDIDLSKGSAFSKEVDKWAEKLENLYKGTYPSLRRRILEKYGIDIFNEDGTVNKEKLELVMMMGGLDKDKFGLEEFIGGLPKTDPEWIQTIQPTTPVPTLLYGPPSVNPTTTAPTSSTTPSPTEGSVSASHGAQVVGAQAKDISSASTNAAIKDASSLSKKIATAISAGASFKKPIVNVPKIPTVTTAIKTKGASTGVLAAAALVAGGSIAGGGILLGKKLKYEKFSPADWLSLDADTQMSIESSMRNVGFTEEEIATLENSYFKISAEELNDHKTKIENATKDSIEIEESLLSQYGYSMFDSSGSVNKYLLFVTMVIDGKNSVDSYNIYDYVNMGATYIDNSDFSYSGISMTDYLDKNHNEKEDSEESVDMSSGSHNNENNDLKLESYDSFSSEESSLSSDSFESYVSPGFNQISDSTTGKPIVESYNEPTKEKSNVVVTPVTQRAYVANRPVVAAAMKAASASKSSVHEITPKTNPVPVGANAGKDATEEGFSLADSAIPTIPHTEPPTDPNSKYDAEEAPKEWLKNIGIY